eukprot:5275483-Pleurochrysis_carterae.AAC.1
MKCADIDLLYVKSTSMATIARKLHSSTLHIACKAHVVATKSPQAAHKAIHWRNAQSQTPQNEYSVPKRVNVGSQTMPLPPPVTRVLHRPPPNMD